MESAITSKGQTTIPKPVRDRWSLKPGDRVKYFFHPDGHLAILPVLPASALKGILRSRLAKAPTLEEMDEAIASHLAEKYKRK